jgi:acyl homoserine lactone synthase
MKTIFKGMYQWCLAHDVRYTYMVVENRLLRVVERLGWPCRAIGAPVAIPPAEVFSIGALLDLDLFRDQAKAKRPEMLSWLNSLTPVLLGSEAQVGIGTGSENDREDLLAELAESRR